MSKPPAVKSIHLRNLLSFGEESEPLELGPLNVLIGANGSGKSNLIEAFALLQAAPRDLRIPVWEGGGIKEWLWKGGSGTPTASIEVRLGYDKGTRPLRYKLSITDAAQRLTVTDERIENESETRGHLPLDSDFLYGYVDGQPVLVTAGITRPLRRETIDPQQSILSQRKDPDQYPELTFVGERFESFRFYREWEFGRRASPRLPQPADLPGSFLAEDLRNLALVLNRLRQNPAVRRSLLERMKTFYPGVDEIHISLEGGTAQVLLEERGYTVPATRLSDGTLHWLCLLAILLHPSPPPLVCIEEPELGLHPDLMPTLATLLCEASERMQLIVTTHSDILVDAFNATPEAIIVCDKQDGATFLKRLSREELSVWLEKYTLGQLWERGEIGGNRW